MDQYFEALEKSKNSIALNIVEQMGFDETADVLEKGKKASVGEIRDWNGTRYQKQPNGSWNPIKKNRAERDGGGQINDIDKLEKQISQYQEELDGWENVKLGKDENSEEYQDAQAKIDEIKSKIDEAKVEIDKLKERPELNLTEEEKNSEERHLIEICKKFGWNKPTVKYEIGDKFYINHIEEGEERAKEVFEEVSEAAKDLGFELLPGSEVKWMMKNKYFVYIEIPKYHKEETK